MSTIDLRKRMMIELLALTAIFAVSFSLPFCEYYSITGGDESAKVKPLYLLDFPFAWLFAINFLLVLLGTFSLNKLAARIFNICAINISILAYFYLKIAFSKQAEGLVHPTFGMGYWACHVILLILVVRSFMWRKSFPEMVIKKRLSNIFIGAAISIPVLLGVFVAYRLKPANTKPMLVSRNFFDTPERVLKNECWDYKGSYSGAFANKYYSKPKSDNSSNEKVGNYRLDSVQIIFFDENHAISKQFTKPAINGKANIEKLIADGN